MQFDFTPYRASILNHYLNKWQLKFIFNEAFHRNEHGTIMLPIHAKFPNQVQQSHYKSNHGYEFNTEPTRAG